MRAGALLLLLVISLHLSTSSHINELSDDRLLEHAE
jgi:hypothetical protein